MLEADRTSAAALEQLLNVIGVPRQLTGRPDPEKHQVVIVPPGMDPPDPTVTSVVLGARGARGRSVESPKAASSGYIRVFGRRFPVAGPMHTPDGARVDADGFISAVGEVIHLGVDPVGAALEFYSGRGGPCRGRIPPLDSMADLLRRLLEACYHSWDLPFVRIWPHPRGADFTAVSPVPRRLTPAPDGAHWLKFVRSGGRGVVTSLRATGDRPCAGTTFPFRPMPGGRLLPILEPPQSGLSVETRAWKLVALSTSSNDSGIRVGLKAYVSWWIGRWGVSATPGYDGKGAMG